MLFPQLTGDSSSFGYTIPSNGDKQQFVIFAYGTTNPGSSDVNADLVQHFEYRTVYFDLTKNLTPATPATPATTSSGAKPTTSHAASSDDIPLLPYQRMIVAHAIFCVVGFLLFLPGGALLARYLRTYSPTWFTGHWAIQLVISGPTIVAGAALGVASVNKAGARHLDDSHKVNCPYS
ncbi:hypothetical protein DXG03_002060 [Asterophora parasitica]|uniref:Cytochrome b561 domain-containing protein n=1 Tax=Asterophora parasitica TaxID=117018 RepID=A0A9P7G4Q8_9AGAR|nr:hypothetical protein DXG03_002060 [Asterophora parasitica]